MRSYCPSQRLIPAVALCLLAPLASAGLARAATVAPPARPEHNKIIVIQAGEVPEARAKLVKKQSNKIKNKRNYTRDDSLDNITVQSAN